MGLILNLKDLELAMSEDLDKLRLELLGDLLLRTLARLKATAGIPRVETGWYCTMSAVMSYTALAWCVG